MRYRLTTDARFWPFRVPSGVDGTRLARNLVFSIFWPALSALIYIIRYPRTREVTGILVFCGYVGWVLTPTPGSDSHTYGLKILNYRAGLDGQIKEPLLRGITEVINFFGFDPQWYFVLLGLIFGVAWIWCAKLMFNGVKPDARIGFLALAFVCAFFLYYPVFPAVNARYTTAMWVLFAATLLALNRQWRLAFAVGVCGASIHFGHIMFLAALGILYLSRYAKNLQLPFAYLFLLICMFLPPQFMLEFGDLIGDTVGGSLGGTIESSTHFGQRSLAGDFDGGGTGRVWFIHWYRTVIFIALLISGHFLFWKYCRREQKEMLFQLWILIIVMWGLYYAMSAHGVAMSRLRRNTTGLLLLWHALYFLRYRRGGGLSLAILAGPLVFFYVVAYRIWFHQISVAVFLPLPFGYFADWWPRIMEMLGFG